MVTHDRQGNARQTRGGQQIGQGAAVARREQHVRVQPVQRRRDGPHGRRVPGRAQTIQGQDRKPQLLGLGAQQAAPPRAQQGGREASAVHLAQFGQRQALRTALPEVEEAVDQARGTGVHP